MKYDMTPRMMGAVLGSMCGLPDKSRRKALKQEYRSIWLRASDIGSSNNLIGSYVLAAWFIAMNRTTGLDAEGNYQILEKGLRTSRLFKAFMGDSKGYFSEKHMAFRREWSKKTHERKYRNDWVVDVLEKTEDYEFGFDYTECGVCKLCRDESCFELAKYLCRLDYLLVEIMGIHLDRTMTLANGDPKCDFRFVRQD